MNKGIKWLLIAVICAVTFIGVFFLYGELKDDYAPDRFADTTQAEEGSPSESERQKAPDFTVTDENGNRVKLSDYFGKPIVLNFWATWCGYCVKEMPDFNQAFHNNPDIQFMMINVTDGMQETMESAKAFIKSKGFDFPVFYDTTLQAADTYGASGLPMTIFIDRNGYPVTYANGMLTAENLKIGLDMIK